MKSIFPYTESPAWRWPSRPSNTFVGYNAATAANSGGNNSVLGAGGRHPVPCSVHRCDCDSFPAKGRSLWHRML